MEANARRRSHPFDLALALTLGTQLFDYLCDSDALLQRTEEAERISNERGIALFGEIMVEISRGVALLRAGRLIDASTQLDQGIERLMQTEHRYGFGILGPCKPRRWRLPGTSRRLAPGRGERRPDRGRRGAVALCRSAAPARLDPDPVRRTRPGRGDPAQGHRGRKRPNPGSFVPRPRSPAHWRAAEMRQTRSRYWRRSAIGSRNDTTQGFEGSRQTFGRTARLVCSTIPNHYRSTSQTRNMMT
jgi:hypothetical protein